MRILHFGTSVTPVLSELGGALQRRILEMASRQAALGHEVTVLSPGEQHSRQAHQGFTLVEIPLRLQRPWRDFEFAAKARRSLRGEARFDILHSHGAPHSGRILGGAARGSVHSVDFFEYRGSSAAPGHAYYRWALDGFSANLPVSDYCQEQFTAYYPSLRRPVRKLGNGVNMEQFSPDAGSADEARQQLGIPDGPVVLYLGRVCEQKGSDLLADLARGLAEQGANATVVAAGPPEQFDQTGVSPLMDDLARAGVVCTGAVPEHLLSAVLNTATVFVLPTRRLEMFGMAAVEAQACGLPVVASRHGGIPEAIGSAGVLFEPGDSAGLTSAVAGLLTDHERVRDLGARSREHAASWDWDTIVAAAQGIYDEVLRGR